MPSINPLLSPALRSGPTAGSGAYPKSVFLVLPRARDGALLDPATKSALDPLDFNLWLRNGWGLANSKQDKVLQILLRTRAARNLQVA